MKNESYNLIDSGNGRKLERFGPYLLSRPASQAVWAPQLPESEWQKAEGERQEVYIPTQVCTLFSSLEEGHVDGGFS